MKLKNILLTSLVIGGMLISCGKEKDRELVRTGRIGYNKGPIESRNFMDCSAVILDYNNEALFAHAIPEHSLDLRDFSAVGAYDVVDTLVKEAKIKGFDLSETIAHINAGDKELLDSILNDLQKYKIKVETAQIKYPNWREKSGAGIRDAIYFPSQDRLEIKPVSLRKFIRRD